MADSNNSGQFEKGSERARKAARASSGKFESGSKRASDAGKEGAKHEPMEARREGGKHSHSNQ